MANVEHQERRPVRRKLLECKYDLTTEDIFLILTEEALVQLRQGDNHPSNRSFQLSAYHPQTGARFILRNDVSLENERDLMVTPIPSEDNTRWFLVLMSDHAYNILKGNPGTDSERTISDRYETCVSSKVFVTVNPEMVDMLTHQRTENFLLNSDGLTIGDNVGFSE